MRNLFDQFSQPENKLTHALASSLAMDAKLARNFAKWAADLSAKASAKISVSQQGVPGEPNELGDDERRSLPDACLYIPEEWCLVIESKVTAAVVADQLARHRQMVGRSFSKVEVLLLTAASNPRVSACPGCRRKPSRSRSWRLRHSAARRPSLPVLQRQGHHAGPCHAALSGRSQYLDQSRRLLPPLQSAQGRSYPGAGWHGATAAGSRAAVPAL